MQMLDILSTYRDSPTEGDATMSTVNVSFPRPLLKAMDAVAKREARSRSELLREAARLYLERQRRWDHIFAFGRRQTKRLHLKPADVGQLIASYRHQRARR